MKWPICAATALLVACGSSECLNLPCAPSGPAVMITVTTTTGVNPVSAGLTASVISGQQRALFCDSGALCEVFGGIGDYTIRVTATGFTSQEVRVTVTGQEAGCSRCERIDTQHLSVALAPAA